MHQALGWSEIRISPPIRRRGWNTAERSPRWRSPVWPRLGESGARVTSNDGCLLECFRARDVSTLGISRRRSRWPSSAQHPTEVCFFGVDSRGTGARRRIADRLCEQRLAHVRTFMTSLRGSPRARFRGVMRRVSSSDKLIREVQFDTIYQEHYSYFTLASALRVLGGTVYGCSTWTDISTHGGSLGSTRAVVGPTGASSQALTGSCTPKGRCARSRRRIPRLQRACRASPIGFLEFLIAAPEGGESRPMVRPQGNTFLNYCGSEPTSSNLSWIKGSKAGDIFGTHLQYLLPRLRGQAGLRHRASWNLRAGSWSS